MSVLALITLLRIIPYAIVLYIAIAKGFKWLAMTMIYLFVLLGVTYFLQPNEVIRGVLGSLFALFLLMHVLDLKNRRSRADD
jgi:hypothetical protein